MYGYESDSCDYAIEKELVEKLHFPGYKSASVIRGEWCKGYLADNPIYK